MVRVAAPSDHELGLEQDPLVLDPLAGELLDEQAHDVLAGLIEGLADARQRHGGETGGG